MIKLYNLLFEEHRHGNVFGDFLGENPNKKEEILLKLGVPQNKLQRYLDKIDYLIGNDRTIGGKANKQSINQIFAVIDGQKPMWFGGPENISKLGIIKTVLMKNLSNLGLVYFRKDNQAVLGKPENVEKAAAELERVMSSGKYLPDKEFHRNMGIALGYPAEDVETFVKMFR